MQVRRMLALAALLLALGSAVDRDDSSRAGRATALAAGTSAVLPRVDLDAVRFVRQIDNVWWPLERGSSWRYRRIADGKTLRIVTPGQATVGTTYARERRKNEAERRGWIVSSGQVVAVPAGLFERTLVTETTTLGTRLREHATFARGVGPVLTIDLSGRGERAELVQFTRGSKGS